MTDRKLWRQVSLVRLPAVSIYGNFARDLPIQAIGLPKALTNASYQLRQIYMRLLHAFETEMLQSLPPLPPSPPESSSHRRPSARWYGFFFFHMRDQKKKKKVEFVILFCHWRVADVPQGQ